MRPSFLWTLPFVVTFGAFVFWPKGFDAGRELRTTTGPARQEQQGQKADSVFKPERPRASSRQNDSGVQLSARKDSLRGRVDRHHKDDVRATVTVHRNGSFYQWIAPKGIRPVIRKSDTPTFSVDAAEWVADSLIVTTKSSETSESLKEQLASRGALAAEALGNNGKLWKISIRPSNIEDFFTIADSIGASGALDFIDYNFVLKTGAVSNDSLLPMQYGVGDAQTSGIVLATGGGYSLVEQSVGANVNAMNAWNTKHDCGAIRVAVLDSGVDATHPDLADNLDLVSSRNFVSNADLQDDCSQNSFSSPAGGDASVDPSKFDDENGHGTHVAGTIGAVGNNGVGVAGVCWKAKIVTLRAMNKCGRGTNASILAAIDYATKSSVRVLNMSLGGNTNAANISPGGTGYQAIDAFAKSGGLSVVAAGNSASDNAANPVFPASIVHPSLISVASHNALNEISNYSNFSNTNVHIAAPGEGILSTVPQTITSGTPEFFKSNAANLNAPEKFKKAAMTFPDVGYDFKDGTSMASPHVAGVAALVWSMDSARTAIEVKNLIYETSDVVPGFQSKVVSGRRVNVGRAVAAAEGFALRQGGSSVSDASSAVVGTSESIYVQVNAENFGQLKSGKLFLGAAEIGTCSEFDGTCVGRAQGGAVGAGVSEALRIQSETANLTVGFVRVVQLSQSNGLFASNAAGFSCRLQTGLKTIASFKAESMTVCKNLCRMLVPRQAAEQSSCLYGDKSESLTLEACDASSK